MTVAIIGGGLAGMAAAVAAVEVGHHVELFETRGELGGRAGSFHHPRRGTLVDFCPHVAMGCCTNLVDLCRRTGVSTAWRRHRTLHFVGPDATRSDFSATGWLPAPLHLLPALRRLPFLSSQQRRVLAHSLWRLAHARLAADERRTAGQWLREQGESPEALERFWSPVILSALAAPADCVALTAVQRVICDGFLASRHAYELLTPERPLGEIWQRVGKWLATHGATLHLGTPVARLQCAGRAVRGVVLRDGTRRAADAVIVAVPWQRMCSLLTPEMAALFPELGRVTELPTATITAVDLSYDRPITDLPHAAIVGRLSQWLFAGPSVTESTAAGSSPAYHYRVVISGARGVAGRARDDILAEVRRDVEVLWPAAREATLLDSRVLTRPAAVFVLAPGVDGLRPPQRTPVANLAIAGDWTDTGWPATMEGAVRSGYLAADAVLPPLGGKCSWLVPDLPRGWLARRLR
jgi:squalene-associated FAD-dependent desaturase